MALQSKTTAIEATTTFPGNGDIKFQLKFDTSTRLDINFFKRSCDNIIEEVLEKTEFDSEETKNLIKEAANEMKECVATLITQGSKKEILDIFLSDDSIPLLKNGGKRKRVGGDVKQLLSKAYTTLLNNLYTIIIILGALYLFHVFDANYNYITSESYRSTQICDQNYVFDLRRAIEKANVGRSFITAAGETFWSYMTPVAESVKSMVYGTPKSEQMSGKIPDTLEQQELELKKCNSMTRAYNAAVWSAGVQWWVTTISAGVTTVLCFVPNDIRKPILYSVVPRLLSYAFTGRVNVDKILQTVAPEVRNAVEEFKETMETSGNRNPYYKSSSSSSARPPPPVFGRMPTPTPALTGTSGLTGVVRTNAEVPSGTQTTTVPRTATTGVRALSGTGTTSLGRPPQPGEPGGLVIQGQGSSTGEGGEDDYVPVTVGKKGKQGKNPNKNQGGRRTKRRHMKRRMTRRY